MKGAYLPSSSEVVSLYKRENIPLMRLFEPEPEVLEALKGSGIKVALGIRNEDVPYLANDVNMAIVWVNNNVVPYAKDVNFGWITLGNEMVPGDGSELIPQAMNNILSGLNGVGLTGIKVSTVVSSAVLGETYPPSAGDFTSEARGPMTGIIEWLVGTDNPILFNVYPYFAYMASPDEIPLGFALFDTDQPIIDGEYKYYSLFEAMVDAFYAALEKNGGRKLTLVVSETGWPTAGNEPHASKMKQTGTPRRPADILDIFLFAMFNEDEKPPGVEQHWGIHYANMDPVYTLTF
ncbi:hypothetical protein Cgig2_029514 [Carnegiea gigantea]|uniref:Glucan endo-1,3-beta-D-glucosidase n=1 Tax=Carnegiea gigantea TaxID=171969 RepID=A0A9Q1KM51_9CARY|nr:hypothetical protein Cgig2_029514 [Carnegiea gigantea]